MTVVTNVLGKLYEAASDIYSREITGIELTALRAGKCSEESQNTPQNLKHFLSEMTFTWTLILHAMEVFNVIWVRLCD